MRTVPAPDKPQALPGEASRVKNLLKDGVRDVKTTYGALMTLEYWRGTFDYDPAESLSDELMNKEIIIRSKQLDWFTPSERTAESDPWEQYYQK